MAQLYWDTNGRTSGASGGDTAPGTWGVDNFWNSNRNGNGNNTTAWTPGQQAVFSAGGNATGAFTVGVSGIQTASGIVFEEGTVTLSGGTLLLTNGVGNATLNVASTNFATIASTLNGSSGLVKSGTGTLLLTGTNAFSGVTDLQQGALLVSKPSSLGSSTLELDGGTFGAFGGPVSVNNAVTINNDSFIGGSANLTFSGNVTQQGGSHTLTFNNPAQTTFSGGTFVLGNTRQSSTLTLNLLGGAVTIADTIQDGPISRGDSLAVSGSGTLLLSGNNTFSGGLQLNGGILFLGNNNAAGTGTLTLGNNVTVGATNGSRSIGNALSIQGNVTFIGPDSLTFLSAFDLGGNRTFTVLNTTTFSGRISGPNDSLTKLGAGTLVLNGPNSFGGSGSSLFVNAGTVALGNNSAAGRGSTAIVLNGGTIQASGAARTLSNPVVVSNNSTIGGSLNLVLSGPARNLGGSHTLTISNSALTTLSGNSLSLAGSGGTATLTVDVSAASGGLSISAPVQNGSGVGSLIKNGSGRLTLSGRSANTFSGGFTINAGTVTAGKVNALGSGPLTLNGASLSLGTFRQTVGTFTLAGGTLTGTSGTLTASSFQLQSGTVGAILAGSGALVKSTAGTVTLSAANTFSGGSTLNAGTLRLINTSGSATGSGVVTVNSGATLTGSGSIAGSLILNSGGVLAPGDPVGTFSTANETWNGGAHLALQMKDALSGAGLGWDLLRITGSLTIHASAANPLYVDLQSLTLSGASGPVYNFNSSLSYNWTIVTTSSGITFDAGQSASTAFRLNLGSFANNTAGGSFSFSLANGNKNLVLDYTPAAVPEPDTLVIVGIGFGLLLVQRRFVSRRRH